MGTSQTTSGKSHGFQHNGGMWKWRCRTWQTVTLYFSCVILTMSASLPQASADLSNETAVLLSIKQGWGNPTILNTWSRQFNICSQWQYVTCDAHNTTVIALTLSVASVQAPLPESIGALVNLQQLTVENWGLVGNIPSNIGLLRNLLNLTLDGNTLNGSIPPQIGNLTKLVKLDLSGNKLSEVLPQELSKLKLLEKLLLGNNQLSGPIPTWIGSFPALINLYLVNNDFTGNFPTSVANLTNLQQLQMTNAWDVTNSAGPLPSELGKMTSLTTLLLEQIGFQGSIPESFGNLSRLIYLDLDTCSLVGSIPPSLGNLSNLQQLDLHLNSLSGPIPPEFGKLNFLTLLDIYSNSLSGPIPEELGNATSLIVLDVHLNDLNGQIPIQLSQLTNLILLDLSYNNLDGEIPQKLLTLPNLTQLSLQDNCLSGPIPKYNTSGPLVSPNFGQATNSNCFNADQVCKCDLGAPSPSFSVPATAGEHGGLSKSENVYIAVGVVLGSLVALFGLLGFWFLRHKHQRKLVNPSSTYKGFIFGEAYRPNDALRPGPVREYTVAQIKEATKNFSTKVGEGGFATVYKAVFGDGTVAAVKRFNKKRPVESFEKEVELLSSLNHRFLLNLLGYCEDLDEGEHILLYEFMDRGNLNECLHDCHGCKRPPLTWEERKRVLISVGHGIDYLHYGTDPPMIHRDIKSANILLSSSGKSLIAKLADFGLGRQTIVDADVVTATFGSEPPKAFSTRIAGTPGYFDPEYVTTSVLSAKTDVYTYGVVLLELITGKPPLLEERFTLTEWAKPFLEQEDVWAILDPLVDKESCNEGQLRAVAELAYRCTKADSRDRPTMKEVLAFLTEIFSVETRMVNPSLRTSSSTVGFSGTSDSYSSLSRGLAVEIEMNSMNYTNSEILPRD